MRPANANPEATRRRILDGAIALFAQGGFHGASSRDLAGAAGVNVATLHYYFGGKQGLYDAAVDEVYRRIRARTQQALTGVPLEDIEAVLTRLYAVARAERDGVRVLVRQVLDLGRLSPHTEQSHFLPELAVTARFVADVVHCSAERAREATVALGYLLSRYAIQDDQSLMSAYGVRTVGAAHARVVATLVSTFRALAVRGKKKE